jgi:hypothetical protein
VAKTAQSFREVRVDSQLVFLSPLVALRSPTCAYMAKLPTQKILLCGWLAVSIESGQNIQTIGGDLIGATSTVSDQNAQAIESEPVGVT